MSKEEKWVSDIKEKIDKEVELNLWSLERLAVQNDIDINYVLETYRDKVVYRINNILK